MSYYAAIAYVNARPRPLALYFFGPDGANRQRVLKNTTSGNVTINDTMIYSETRLATDLGIDGLGKYVRIPQRWITAPLGKTVRFSVRGWTARVRTIALSSVKSIPPELLLRP